MVFVFVSSVGQMPIEEVAMAFEVFTREVIRTTDPRVTITNLGRFSINNSATNLLRGIVGAGVQSEMRVLLLWDKSTNRIAIQPAKKDDHRSYPLKTYGPKGRSGTGFSAVTFLNYINYNFTETHRYAAEMNGSMLVFTVPGESIKGGVPTEPPGETTARRAKRV